MSLLQLFANIVLIPDEKGNLAENVPAAAMEAIAQSAQMAPSVAPGDFGATFIKMICTMVAIIVLLFFTVWFLRRLIQQRMQKGVGIQSIQILEKRMISPKTMLYLIEAEKKKILIAESHLEIKRLETFESRSRYKESVESPRE